MVAWTTTEPQLSTEVGNGLTYIQDNWTVLETAWNTEHATLTGDGSSSDTHTMVTLDNTATATHAANKIILNATDVSGKAEVHAEHEDNQNIQITATDGTRYGLCGKQFIVIGSDNSVHQLSTTDGTTALHIKDSANTTVSSISSDGQIWMTRATAPTVATGGSLYVDTSDALHIVNSATNLTILGEALTAADPGYLQIGTLIIQWGKSSTGTTFHTAFTTVYGVICSVSTTGTDGNVSWAGANAYSVTTTGFSIRRGGTGSQNVFWVAFGV